MPDTLPNITIPANEWVDLYLLSGIAVGTPIAVEMVGVCDVYLAVKETQPAPDYDAYNVLKRHGDKLRNTNGDSGAWAFCQGRGGKVAVREFDTVTEGFYPGITMPVSEDFLLEVAKGNVPGHALVGKVMRNPRVGSTFVDLWAGPGSLVYPAANEQWEVRSDDINDTLGGTGSHAVTQAYQDEDYVQKSVSVNLDGTNWVPMNSDMFRAEGLIAIPSGSNQKNHGTITVRDVATQDIRQVIDVGFSASQDGHYTVPAGKTMFAMQSQTFYPKNTDGIVRSNIMFFGTNTWVTGASGAAYQNGFTIEIKAMLAFPERTELIFIANSMTPDTDVTAILEMMVVDNDVL